MEKKKNTMPQRLVHVREVDQGHAIASDSTNYVSTEEYQRNEGMRENLRKQLSEIFRPILIAMKLTGQYFGPTVLTEDNKRGTWYMSRFYSTVVLLGQCILIVLAVISHCYIGLKSMDAFFFLLVTTVWYLQCTSATAICLVVLPFAENRRSRFARFLSSLLETVPELNLESIKAKAVKGLILACSAAAINSVVLYLMSVHFNGVISVFPPWNRHISVRVAELVVGTYCSFSWTLPVLIFCVICMLLEKMFSNLQNKISNGSIRTFTMSCLRQEHLKLCETVDLANAIFSRFLFVLFSLEVPLICINFFQLIKSSSETDRIIIVGYFYWSFGVSSLLIFTFLFGNRVNEKVSFLGWLLKLIFL